MRFGLFAAALVLLVFTTAPSRAGDDTGTPRARLATIEAAHKFALERYSAELQKAVGNKAAVDAAMERYLREVYKNVDAALDLARANPGDPAAFEALKFVIRTNRAGPGPGSATAMKMIL
jgi:hypothetical protein